MKYVKINIVYEKKTQRLSKMNILENLQDQQVRNSGIIILNKCSKKVTDKKQIGRSIMAEKTNANIGFEKQIWDAACVLWGHIPAAEYRKVIVGLIFLRYISYAI